MPDWSHLTLFFVAAVALLVTPGPTVLYIVTRSIEQGRGAGLVSRNLDRLAVRALIGLGRTGAVMSNGSGDYVIAFSTTGASEPLSNDATSPLFQAVAEATEEAIYNSLFRATTIEGYHGTVEALPLDRTLEILRKYGVLEWDRRLRPGSAAGSPP